jgi:hypothetical protein
MPTKFQNSNPKLKTKISTNQIRSVRRVFLPILIVGIVVFIAVNCYKSILIPNLIARNLRHNIEVVNIASIYTKEFEQSILASLQKSPSQQAEQSQITSEIDILYTKVTESKSALEESTLDDAQAVYESISYSFQEFQQLLMTTRSYLEYQFCFSQANASLKDTEKLKKDVLSQFDLEINLTSNPELYKQLSAIYSLQNNIYTNLNTCFGVDFAYLKTPDWEDQVTEYINYTAEQSTILDNSYSAAKAKDQKTIISNFQLLANNESNMKDLFNSDYFLVIKYQPLETISQQNKELQIKYTEVKDKLNTVKAKYSIV